MKKVFRLASAEFNKIFYRPSIFILTALLIITLVLTNLLYNPSQNTTKLGYSAVNVNGVYREFLNSNNTINKNSIDASFDALYNEIDEQFDSITMDDKLTNLTNRVTSLYTYLSETIHEEQTAIYGPSDSSNLTSSQREQLIQVFLRLKNMSSDLLSYLPQLKAQTLNFYFTNDQYDTIYNEVTQLYEATPQNYDAYRTKEDFFFFLNTLRSSYTLTSSRQIVGSLERLEIDVDTYNELVEKYYTQAKQNLQNIYYSQIETFLDEHYESTDQEDLDQINEYIAQYYSYTQMNMTVFENKFTLIRINKKSDTELSSLIGYTQVSKYALNEQNSIYDYLLENNDFPYNYLSSFNFNVASGTTSNAYDYTVYSMQILSVLIIVFTVFYACSSIAGDQSNGTMKMIAIRPYTRNKLFTGKYLSCVMFGIMLMLISTVASFIVGAIMYGVPMTQCLVVFNSSAVISIHPILLLFIYLLSLFVNLLFYISLAMFICLLFKSNTLSVFLTSSLYAVQIVLCGLVGGAWLKYTPFGHFDLFKYFGNSHLGMFSMNILPDANFMISAIVLGLLIVIFNSISHLIFKTRDIT